MAAPEDQVVLNVLLNCEVTKTSETKQVQFQSLPTTPLEIKTKIEKDFSIPSCVQTLHYQSMILKDSDQLQHAHFRSGDTVTVDYPIEAECKMAQNVIKWLRQLYDVLKSIEERISSPHTVKDLSSICRKLKHLLLVGENDNIIEILSVSLFCPRREEKKMMNRSYFHQEGGLEVLMKVYGILVSKEWGNLGFDKKYHVYLERKCCRAVVNYGRSFRFKRQIVQLGAVEMYATTLLRKQLQGDDGTLDSVIYTMLMCAACGLSNLSDLPEWQVPLAKRADVINQMLAMALHPAYDCKIAKMSVEMIFGLTQSPKTHIYCIQREIVEKMLEVCKQRHKMVIQQSSQSQQRMKEDLMKVNVLKCYTSMVLAQVGLGSPHLLVDSTPPQLLQQILNLMSDILEAASPAELCQHDTSVWNTFLPILQYLYMPSTIKQITVEMLVSDGKDIRADLHFSCCNVLLYGLEAILSRDIKLHLDVLVKEGLLDYTMCLPAVLPGECQPRARSLVNELGKHRQLQPPSLCTLAKAHIAKTFCGLQPVMEMKAIGEFLHLYFD